MRLSILILCLIFFQTNVFSQTETIDSLKQIINTTNSDTIKINALYEWDGLIYVSNPKLDNELNQQIIDIATKNLSDSVNLNPSEKIFYKKHLALSYNVLGINEDDNGRYIEALDFYYKSLSISEEIGDSGTIGGIYNNIGLIHEKLNNLEAANQYYYKSLKLEKSTGDQEGIVTSYNNIGSIYLSKTNIDSALYFYKKALPLAENNGNQYQIASTLGNIGVAFEQKDDFDSSLYYYNASLAHRETINDWDGLSNVLSNIGLIYVQKSDPEKALKYCRRGFKIAVNNNGVFRTSLNCNCLYQSHKLLNQSDSALFYHEMLDSLNNLLNNDEITRQIAQKEIIYQNEKQNFVDSLKFANELKLSAETLKKTQAEDRLRITILITGLILLALVGLIIYYKLGVTKKQKGEIEKQHEIISSQKHEIEQSINYAKLIQEATLPVLELTQLFNDSFIYYNPKDVVSGDFYWIEEDEKQKYFAVADCTGHGIPGAFISMIGTILLNEIHNAKSITAPNLILDELNRLIQLTLDSGENQMKDGMDIAFCSLEKSTNILSFAGANNPVYIVSSRNEINHNGNTLSANLNENGLNLFEIKGDKQPVGKSYGDIKKFSLNQVELVKGDSVYIFSDGFADQFGGEKGKKFKYKPFKKLILTNNHLSGQAQKTQLNLSLNNWKGELAQVDDICIIGIKI